MLFCVLGVFPGKQAMFIPRDWRSWHNLNIKFDSQSEATDSPANHTEPSTEAARIIVIASYSRRQPVADRSQSFHHFRLDF